MSEYKKGKNGMPYEVIDTVKQPTGKSPFENVDFSNVEKQIINEFGKVFPEEKGECIIPDDALIFPENRERWHNGKK